MLETLVLSLAHGHPFPSLQSSGLEALSAPATYRAGCSGFSG